MATVFGPGRGIVFYVNNAAATGAQFMEAAPSASSWFGIPADPSLVWGADVVVGIVNCLSSVITGATGLEIGTGLANTNAITTTCTAAQAPAAWAAKNYRGGTLNDWFLPSQLELNQLCRYASSQPFNAAEATCTGSLTPLGGFDASYWSSSQDAGDATGVWWQGFDDGVRDTGGKDFDDHVRPVRAF